MTLRQKINQYRAVLGAAALLTFSDVSLAAPVYPGSLVQRVGTQECLETNRLEYVFINRSTLFKGQSLYDIIGKGLNENPSEFLEKILLEKGYTPMDRFTSGTPKLTFSYRSTGQGPTYFVIKVFDKDSLLAYQVKSLDLNGRKLREFIPQLIPPSCQQLRQQAQEKESLDQKTCLPCPPCEQKKQK